MWKEFCAMNPHGGPAVEPAEVAPKKTVKRTVKRDQKKVAPLRIKLPKKKSKKYDSEDEDLQLGTVS